MRLMLAFLYFIICGCTTLSHPLQSGTNPERLPSSAQSDQREVPENLKNRILQFFRANPQADHIDKCGNMRAIDFKKSPVQVYKCTRFPDAYSFCNVGTNLGDDLDTFLFMTVSVFDDPSKGIIINGCEKISH